MALHTSLRPIDLARSTGIRVQVIVHPGDSVTDSSMRRMRSGVAGSPSGFVFSTRETVACPTPEPAPVIRQTLSSSRTLGALGADQPGQRQGDQDDEPVGGVDPERLDLRKDQDVLDQRQQDDAGEGTNHPPAATFKGDPSNDGSSKDLADAVVALAGGDRYHLPRRHPAGQRGRDAVDDDTAAT